MKDFGLDVLNHIDPALVEEAEPAGLQKRRRPRFRAAALAACLCLALVGTGFASQVYRLILRTGEEQGEPYYSVQGEVIKYPLDAFSDELISASEARIGPGAPVQLTFETFDEVQAFLGDVPILWPKGGEDWHGSYGYEVILFHTQTDRLWGVEVYSFDPEAQAEVSAIIRTEHWQGTPDTNIINRHHNPGHTLQQLENYRMSDGAQAEVIMMKGTALEPDCHCYGYFISGGVLYDVEVAGGLSSADGLPLRLKALLDSFLSFGQ